MDRVDHQFVGVDAIAISYTQRRNLRTLRLFTTEHNNSKLDNSIPPARYSISFFTITIIIVIIIWVYDAKQGLYQ